MTEVYRVRVRVYTPISGDVIWVTWSSLGLVRLVRVELVRAVGFTEVGEGRGCRSPPSQNYEAVFKVALNTMLLYPSRAEMRKHEAKIRSECVALLISWDFLG